MNEDESKITGNSLMDGFDKRAVQKRLIELGMGDIARKLESMTEADIERQLRANPLILKKAREIMRNGGNINGR